MAAITEEQQYRRCIWPSCPRRFDYLAAYGGTARPEDHGWYRYEGLIAVFICPTHAGAGHLPGRTIHNDTQPATVTAACSCHWSGEERRSTLGAAKADYVAHLARVEQTFTPAAPGDTPGALVPGEGDTPPPQVL